MVPETLSSEERFLTTTSHISLVVVVAAAVAEHQRHANEIGTRNQTEARTRLEIVTMWLSGRVITIGTVRPLHLYHASRSSASVTDSASASRIGVCRRPDESNANFLHLQLFTISTNAKIRHWLAGPVSVQTLRHENRLSEKPRRDSAGTRGETNRHLRRRHLSGHLHHRLVLKPVRGTVIASHPPMEFRRCDGGVARYTRLLKTSRITRPCGAMRRPRLRAALRPENLCGIRDTRRSRCHCHLLRHTRKTARRYRHGTGVVTGAILRCTTSC
jgi:hypothetical protein